MQRAPNYSQGDHLSWYYENHPCMRSLAVEVEIPIILNASNIRGRLYKTLNYVLTSRFVVNPKIRVFDWLTFALTV